MDVSLVIRRRLEELGLEQKDLARAARVTESYVSQLLTGRRAPPAPTRTDIYERMGKLLRLPTGELARLAEVQRKEALKHELGETEPLYREVRQLVLRKCAAARAEHVRALFEGQPFGELERLITQTLLDVAKQVARQELDNEAWLRHVARLSGHSFEELRVEVLEFLDTDVFHLSGANCVAFLDPLIASWDIDLATFALDILLNERVASARAKRFVFVEQDPAPEEGGFRDFLQDRSLSGTATDAEVEFLRRLKVPGRHPTALYYYRELQNLRDPLHFGDSGNSRK